MAASSVVALRDCGTFSGEEVGKCVRRVDGHEFRMPRRFSKKKCASFARMGSTQKASCAPWIRPARRVRRRKPTRRKAGPPSQQQKCAVGTGYFGDGYCRPDASGNHIVCAKMTKPFMDYAASNGNDLSSVTSPGKRWCICKHWWDRSKRDGRAPIRVPEATHASFYS